MNLDFQQKQTKRTKLSLNLFVALVIFCSIPAFAAQRAAQTFEGVKMQTINPMPIDSPLIVGARNAELTAPAPHVVTLEWYQPGNVLRNVIEESDSPLGPWEVVAVRYNDFIFADTTFAVSFTSSRNPSFWRVAASNTR